MSSGYSRSCSVGYGFFPQSAVDPLHVNEKIIAFASPDNEILRRVWTLLRHRSPHPRTTHSNEMNTGMALSAATSVLLEGGMGGERGGNSIGFILNPCMANGLLPLDTCHQSTTQLCEHNTPRTWKSRSHAAPASCELLFLTGLKHIRRVKHAPCMLYVDKLVFPGVFSPFLRVSQMAVCKYIYIVSRNTACRVLRPVSHFTREYLLAERKNRKAPVK